MAKAQLLIVLLFAHVHDSPALFIKLIADWLEFTGLFEPLL